MGAGRKNPLRSLEIGNSADKKWSEYARVTGCGTRARCSSLRRVSEQRSSETISKLDLGEGCGSSVRVVRLRVV